MNSLTPLNVKLIIDNLLAPIGLCCLNKLMNIKLFMVILYLAYCIANASCV